MTESPLKEQLAELCCVQITQGNNSANRLITQLALELVPFINRLAQRLPRILDPRHAADRPVPNPYGQEWERFCRLLRSGNFNPQLSINYVTHSRSLVEAVGSLSGTPELSVYLMMLGLSPAHMYGILALASAERVVTYLDYDSQTAAVIFVNTVMFTSISHFFKGEQKSMDAELDRITSIMLPVMVAGSA